METVSAIFLVVDGARSQALTRAWERFDDASVAQVELYFRPSTDVALVGVSLRPGSDRGRWIGRVVASGVAVIDPVRMNEGDRRAFFASYLASYEPIARECTGVAEAMTALRARTAQPKAGARGTGPERAIVEEPPAPRAGGTAGFASPDGDVPPALPPIPPAGRKTERGLGALRFPDEPPSVPAATPPAPPAGVWSESAAPDGRVTPEPPAPRAGVSAGFASLDGHVTPALPPISAASEELPRQRAPTVSLRGGNRDTEPIPPRAPSEPSEPQVVGVRFLRGGHWSPARLRSLSARGAYLVTGAPPRIGDAVHVALDLADRTALVRGTVYHVTTARDATTTGSSGFAVRFASDATPARSRLLELLQEARNRGVVIKPPPPRASMRFPVRWPVELRAAHPSHVDALDVSSGGLFVNAPTLAVGTRLAITIPVDVGDPPIELTAAVVRVVSASVASARGLAPGAGLAIVDLSEGDGVRWSRFLVRVERRATRTVLVGASMPRLEAITRALADAGYAVAPCTDPGSLIRLADTGALPDAAVIDASMLDQGVEAGWLEQMFTARQVPCITVRGEAQRTRLVVDRLLAVAH